MVVAMTEPIAHQPRRHSPRERLTINVNRDRKPRPDELVVYPKVQRPVTRADCLPGGCNAIRPCPFVSCRHHLYLDVQHNGSILINYPGREPQEIGHTCALDIADRAGMTLERVAKLLRLSRERVRQICERAFSRLAQHPEAGPALRVVCNELGDDVCKSHCVTNYP